MTDHMTPLQDWDHVTARRAYHEAGHAIAARQLGLKVGELTLDAASIRYPISDSGRRRHCTVSYAGPIAEAQYYRLTSDECRAL